MPHPEPVGARPVMSWRHPPFLWALLAFGAVMGLRYGEVLVGPLAVLLGLLSLLSLPGSKALSDRLIVAFAVIFGWLPVLGWLPHLGTTIDVPGVVLATLTGFAVGSSVDQGWDRMRSRVSCTLSEGVVLALAVSTSLWWVLPFSRLTLSGRLEALMVGFDNNTHFAMFRSNFELGSFTSVHAHLAGGTTRLGSDYPQGMHQAFAQLARLWSPHGSASTPQLLNAYSALLFVLMGFILVAASMAVVRLVRGDFLVALPALGIPLALFGVGPLQTFNGYPNFDLGVAAAAIGTSLVLRPTVRPVPNLFVVAGTLFVAAYNWYPLILLVAPAAALAAYRAHGAQDVQRRRLVDAAIVGIALLALAPLTSLLDRGVGTLSITTGVFPISWSLFIVVVVGLILVVALAPRTGDAPSRLVLASPAVIGTAAVAFVALTEISSHHSITYYGQKLAAGVLAVSAVALACVAGALLTTLDLRDRVRPSLALVLALVGLVGFLQIDGYVGPDATALPPSSLSSGMTAHSLLTTLGRTAPDAQVVLDSAAYVARVTGTGTPQQHWWLVDPQPTNFGTTRYDILADWFLSLGPAPSQQSFNGILRLRPHLFEAMSPTQTAAVVTGYFHDPGQPGLHLIVPESLKQAIEAAGPGWTRPGLLVTIQEVERQV